MSFDRRSIRLPEYDYAQSGAYFITLATVNRVTWFGEINAGEMNINEIGQLVQQEWQNLPRRFPTVEIDVFVIMPNHFHVILWITSNGDLNTNQSIQKIFFSDSSHELYRGMTSRSGSLGAIIGSFKSITTRRIHGLFKLFGEPLWQRNYYEHVIRNPEDLSHAREYIQNNPIQWHHDQDNPTL